MMRCKAKKRDGYRCGALAGASGLCTVHRHSGPSGVEHELERRGLIDMATAVAVKYRCELDDVCGSTRAKSATAARHEVWRKLRSETPLSYPEIGRLFNRDHSTVINGVAKAEARIRSAKLRIAS